MSVEVFQSVQIAMEVWAGIVGLLVILFVSKEAYQDNILKEQWVELIYTNVLLILDVFTYVFGRAKTPETFFTLQISAFGVLFLHSFINWRYTINVNRMIHPSKRIVWNGYVLVSTICIAICLVGLLINPWTETFYFFNDSREFIRGPYVAVSFILPLISMISCGLNIAKNFKVFSKRIGRTFILSMLIIISCIIIQVFVDGYIIINLAINMDILLLLFETNINGREKELRKKEIICSYYEDDDYIEEA